jgi:hypothetical protein
MEDVVASALPLGCRAGINLHIEEASIGRLDFCSPPDLWIIRGIKQND